MLIFFFLVEIATRFSKKKMAEVKEKKDKSVPKKGGFISKRCHLERKAKDEVIEKLKVVLCLSSPVPRSHSPTSSREVLPSSGGKNRKGNVIGDF